MAIQGRSGGVVVGRLRIESRGLDPIAVRVRAGALLANADLRPLGLPPAAILQVRCLRDPLPGRIGLDGAAVAVPCEWAREISEALRRLAERAGRPARGPVSDDAEAVLFADRAEWLACLAIDWLAGRVGRRWWWRDLARATHPDRAVWSAWLDAPGSVPPALSALAAARRALPFVAALPDPVCRAMTERMLRQFGLPEIPATPIPDPQDPGEHRHRSRGSTAVSPPPPWPRWVPEALGDRLSAEASTLVGIGLTLARSPDSARSPRFAAGAARWRRERGSAGSEPIRAIHPAVVSAAEVGRAEVGDARSSRAISPASDAAPEESRWGRAPQQTATDPPWPERSKPMPASGADASITETRDEGKCDPPPSVRREERPIRPCEPPIASDSSQADHPGPAATHATPTSRSRRRPGCPEAIGDVPGRLMPPAQPTPVPESEARDEPPDRPRSTRFDAEAAVVLPTAGLRLDGLESKYGGIFYLINLALFLELYGDFSSPSVRVPGLPLADLIAMLGERWVGPGLVLDPAWSVLGELAGRGAGERPALRFDPPREWRLPPPWLRSFAGDSPWSWSMIGGRLRVRHGSGFPILDVPIAGEPAAQLSRELQAYGEGPGMPPDRDPGPEPIAPEAPLERWLGWLMPYLQARLMRGLGLTDAAEIRAIVFEHPAVLFLASDRLDVVLRLDELPIAIRLAGLDRDPGWVPSLGRSVAFHYR